MSSASVAPSLPHYGLVQVPSSTSSSRPSTKADSTFTTSFTTTTSRETSPLTSPELMSAVCPEDSDTPSFTPLPEASHLDQNSPALGPKASLTSMTSLTLTTSTSSSGASSATSISRTQPPLPYYAAPSSTGAPSWNPPEHQGLMRRFSNRTMNLGRRNSSVPATSRETSLGPALARNTNGRASSPHPNRTIERGHRYPSDNEESLSDREGAPHENPRGVSKLYSVYPRYLVNGALMQKVSKKGRKNVFLFAEPQSATISYTVCDQKRRVIPIDSISQVRYGSDTDQYRSELGASPNEANVWFTLICSTEKSKTKIIHIVAQNEQDLKEWAVGLSSIMRYREQETISLMSFDDAAIAEFWGKEATSLGIPETKQFDTFAMPFDNIEKLCRFLHINHPRRNLLKSLEICDTLKANSLTYAQFREFLVSIRVQHSINHVYYSEVAGKDSSGMTRDEFFSFLRDVQREDVDNQKEHWNSVFKTYAVIRNNSLRFTELSMYNFLRSKYNVTLKKSSPVKMDEPMNRYFISSSHNTYLLGRQIAGSSSVEGYIYALIGGCRCVEIDCWDGPNGVPQVLHGRTLTSAISFESCITGINKWAFYASQYPLWISLEVHTSPLQQARMVQIMKDIFGDRLVTEPLDPMSHTLPSPEELMGRILIKVKKPIVKDEHRSAFDVKTRRRGNSLTSGSPSRPLCEIALPPSLSMPPSPVLQPVGRSKTLPLSTRGFDSASYYSLGQESDSSTDTHTENKTVKVLGDLGVYCTGVKFRGFESPEAKAFNHIFSFKEDSFEKCSRTKDLKRSMEMHNLSYLMRVYPSQFRVTSNNFDPIVYWRRGVQMAALNWQTFDLGMQLNRAMFSGGNDDTGYVLKPPSLRQHEMLPDVLPGHHQRKEIRLNLLVISAQQLICPSNVRVMNPFVEVEVFHASDPRYKTNADSRVKEDMVASQKHRTRIISDNGYNPKFLCPLQIDLITRHEELVFLRFSVKLSSDATYPSKETPPIAVYMVKLVNLNNGYRFLPLWDRKGARFLFSNLFCKINVEYIRPITVVAESPQTEATSKLRSFGDKVKALSRSASTSTSTATSPRSTMDKETAML
ncbi:hypothetical protein BROUX41_004644 [Berkeleyomyces rouxiae]